MTRFEQLCEITGKLCEQQQTIIKPLLEDIVFMEARLCELRKLPHLRVHPKNPARQEVTPAGKQYKETMQSYLNAVKVILTAINRSDTSAADELISKLEEFQL
jgi:hypothetical protein